MSNFDSQRLIFFPPTPPEYFCYCHSWHSFLYFPSFSEGNVRYRTELRGIVGKTGTKHQRRATQNTRDCGRRAQTPRRRGKTSAKPRQNLLKTLRVSLATPFSRLFPSQRTAGNVDLSPNGTRPERLFLLMADVSSFPRWEKKKQKN